MKKTTIAILITGLVSTLSALSTEAGMPELGDASCDSVLLVSGWWNDNVKIYDGCSGEYIRDLDSQGLIKGPLAMAQAPDGDLLVVSETNGRLIKYDYETLSTGTVVMGDDPSTEAIEDNFIKNPSGMVMSNEGSLYIGSYTNNNVVQVDPSSWTIVKEILPAGNALVRGIDVGLYLHQDHLYIPGWESHNVIKVDLSTSEASTAVAAGAGGLNSTRAILVDGDNLLVSGERSGAIHLFNKNTGEYKSDLLEIGRPTSMRHDGDEHFLLSTLSAVYRVRYDDGSFEQLVDKWAGELSGGTNVYRLYKTNDDDDKDGLANEDEATQGTDPLDPDSDDDNLNDGDEVHIHKSNPLSADSDNDQLPDDYEIEHGFLINTADSNQDPDQDDLTNLQEYQAGTLPLNSDTDGDGEKDSLDANPLIPNSAPELTGLPAVEVLQDAEYLFEPQLSYSGDLNTVTLSISNKPDWLTFDSATGALSGSPNNAQVGIYEGIYIAATNGHHNVGLEGFSIQVINVNDTPILVDDVPNQAFTLGAPQSLSLASYFDDIDEGDELTYSATDLPAGLSLDSKGLLSGTPSSAGSFTTKITATDNSSEAVETSFTINVADNKSSGGGGGSFASLFLAFLAFTWSARRVLGK